jgi:hypothetical protein
MPRSAQRVPAPLSLALLTVHLPCVLPLLTVHLPCVLRPVSVLWVLLGIRISCQQAESDGVVRAFGSSKSQQAPVLPQLNTR